MLRSWLMLVLAIVSFIVFLFFWFTSRLLPTGDDNCRLDGVVPAHTVFLLDQSDPFNDNDLAWLNTLVREESRSLRQYDRFSVFSVNRGDEEQPSEIFSRCSPGAPNRFTFLYRNERQTEKYWKEKFELDLEDRIRTELTDRIADISPLIEYFEAILRRPDFSPGVEHRRLVVISDMIQNSKAYSYYRDKVDWEQFKVQTGFSPQPKFSGVEVKIYLAERPGGPAPERLKLFWKSYFESQGGTEPEYALQY